MTEIVLTPEPRDFNNDENEATYSTLSNQSSDDNLRNRNLNSSINGS